MYQMRYFVNNPQKSYNKRGNKGIYLATAKGIPVWSESLVHILTGKKWGLTTKSTKQHLLHRLILLTVLGNHILSVIYYFII